jgi:transcription elongation GreA/GreB family factor
MTNNTHIRVQASIHQQIETRETRLAAFVVAITQAISEGDISENSGLEDLRSEADRLRLEIADLQASLETFQDDLATRVTSNVGAKFTLRHQEKGAVLVRTLIVSEELGTRRDGITDTSEVGKYLLNAIVGDQFNVVIQRGSKVYSNTYTVLKIANEGDIEGLAAD